MAKSASRTRSANRARANDAISILMDDHERMNALFDKSQRMKAGDPRRTELIQQACRELELHTAIEEQVFYPGIRGRIEEDGLVEEAEVEHDSARRLIGRLQQLDPQDSKYAATFNVLAEYVRHHVKVEESQMFRQARQAKIDLAAMGKQLQELRRHLVAQLLEGAPVTGMTSQEEGQMTMTDTEHFGRGESRQREPMHH